MFEETIKVIPAALGESKGDALYLDMRAAQERIFLLRRLVCEG